MCWVLFIFLLCTHHGLGYHQWRTVPHHLTQNPDYSSFNALLINNRVAKLNLDYQDLSIFVPDNNAMNHYNGPYHDGFVPYHIVLQVKTYNNLNGTQFLESSNVDLPMLWISTTRNGIYVNNAKIVLSPKYPSDIETNTRGKQQVLHVIDRVLDPMMRVPVSKPNALDFLTHYPKWKLNGNNLVNFHHKVLSYNLENLFSSNGNHTFFIPIDEEMDDYKYQTLDSYLIKAHVVPNLVLFTRPTEKNFIFETACNGDYIYVVLSMVQMGTKTYVKSQTVLGDTTHKKGEILSEIVVPNIPLSNGVAHLITNPLGVFNRELKPFPYLNVCYKIESDPELNISSTIGQKSGLNQILHSQKWVFTYFVPSNRAWREKPQSADILTKHLVLSNTFYSMTKLAMMAKNSTITLNTPNGLIHLGITQSDGYYHLVWMGRKIRVHRPDYECDDGIVHIVDDLFDDVATEPESKILQDGGFWFMLQRLLT